MVAAWGLPRQRVGLEADGTLVVVVRHTTLRGEGLLLLGDAREDDRGGDPRRWWSVPNVVDALDQKSYLNVNGHYLVVRHEGGDHGLHKANRPGETLNALVDRRRVTDDTLVGGGDTTALDGGGGENGCGGQVGLTDWYGAIAVTDCPTTARGSHRGHATTLHLVLLVSDVVVDPNDVGNIGGNLNPSAERRHGDGEVVVDGWDDRMVGGCNI